MSNFHYFASFLVLVGLFCSSLALYDEDLPSCQPTNNLLIGVIGPQDKHMGESRVKQGSMTGATFAWTKIYEFEGFIISYVMAFENNFSQNATVYIREGGIGYPNVTITMQGVPDRGFDYSIVIWAKPDNLA